MSAVSLKQLAESKAEGIQKATYFKVHPDKVEFESGFNLREEGPELDAHLDAMYQAMKAGAYFPPIDVSVVDGRVVARDGHCRTRTAKRLVAEGIEYMLEARQYRGNETECVLHMLGTANGKALTPLEAGRGYLRLIRYGLEVQDIVSRVGVSRATVENGLMLAEAPVEIQKMVSAGKTAAHVAVDMIRKHGSKAAEVLRESLEKAQAEGKARVTKKHVSAPRVPPKIVQSLVSASEVIATAIGGSDLDNADGEDLISVKLPAKYLRAFIDALYGAKDCNA